MNPAEADEILAAALLADAEAHNAGRYEEVAERYDEIEGKLQCLTQRRFAIALNFWDSWADARNHDWNYYPGITQFDWSKLASEIANSLRNGSDPINPVIVERFAPENLRPLRVRLLERVKQWRGGSE